MIPPLCFITDAGAPRSALAQAEAAARAGAPWIQLRDKTLADADFARLAREMSDRLAPLGAKLFLNDRVDVALALRTDGLHIGQSDGDPALIRDLIGPEMILGLSVDTDAQLAAIPEGIVDYLGIGPVRATASKSDHATPLGLEGAARIIARTALPCLAIGGLTHADTAPLKAAGAAGMAVVSAISRAPDMGLATAEILQAWSRA
ncbi:thiamine phosphate synthase [Pseudooceanicola sp. CBS1P-1]|uniref:Thiamine-phosphate synthase n=1 Tax=Pseudooceanicola albus TaxID=2692189 RepID=A0A6L7G4X3_9RHOB|nr:MULTISPECIES: thiamine phosphate synthase [Pseudooceanicola]MBT9382987.1 thiamine phosphate synthase [Pseudooceanicola endophyticus]MXN19175.1 thiamine phosphate synthase [Pseudooceanicola albus]